MATRTGIKPDNKVRKHKVGRLKVGETESTHNSAASPTPHYKHDSKPTTSYRKAT